MPDALEERYDAVAYPTHPQPGMHPDGLAVVALLSGLKTKPIDRCRVLDLGCGDGGMLLPLAVAYPKSDYVGVDLAGAPVARGQEMIAELGLTNIRLLKGDIRALPGDLGQFDFIIAHGVYSWVPAEVRDALLAACRAHLSENGVAFVSYNALPGGHLREMLRDMMFFHTRDLTDQTERIQQARSLVQLLATLPPRPGVPDAYQSLMVGEARSIAARTEADFFHDDFAEFNEPIYVSEFAAHAAAHDFQLLGEADFFEMSADLFPEEVADQLATLGAQDFVAKEQYLDFLKCRQFRKTLVCRKEVTLDRRFRPDDIARLYASCEAEAEEHIEDGEAAVSFGTRNRGSLTTKIPLLIAALAKLREVHPGALPFSALLDASLAGLERPPSRFKASRQLAEFLYRGYAAGLIELHTQAPHVVRQPGDRPEATALARLQLRRGETDVVGLRSEGITVRDEAGRALVQMLDGTRDRQALLAEMAPYFGALPKKKRAAFLERKLGELGLAGILLR